MEDGGLFEGLDVNFLDSSEEESFNEGPGFNPVTGEVEGSDDNEEEESQEEGFEKELSFVNDDSEEDDSEEEQDNEEIDEDTLDSGESPSSPLTSLTSALHEEGVLSSLTAEELAEIKSGKDLINVIKKQVESNEYSDLSEDQKEYLKALRSGVPDTEYREIKKSASQLSKIDPETLEGEEALDFRKQVLIQDFISKGFEQDEAEKYAGRSIDLGEDIEDSKKALARLKASEAKRLADLSANAEETNKRTQEEYNKKVNDLKVKINSTKEILPNIKLNESTQNKIFEAMTKTAGYDKNNNPVNAVVKNMIEDQDYVVKLNYLHVLTDGFKDWSSLTGTVGSSAVNKLDKALAAQDAKIKAGASEKHSSKASGIINALDNIL